MDLIKNFKKRHSNAIVIILVITSFTPTVEAFHSLYHASRAPSVVGRLDYGLPLSRRSRTVSYDAAKVAGSGVQDLDRHGQLNIVVNGDASHKDILSSQPHGPDDGESAVLPSQQLLVHDHITATDKAAITATTSLGLLLFLVLLKASGKGGWRYFLAGGICAATSHALTTPIDVVKTRKQVDPQLLDKSFGKATMMIVKNEGMKALLAGLGPTTLGYLMEGSIKFGIYEILKPVSGRLVKSLARLTSMAILDSTVLQFVLCGAASGIAASVVLCPMEALRIRVVSEPDFAPRGWVQCGFKMVKIEGISALWKGLTPMLYKQVPYTIAKNVSFDMITRVTYSLLYSGGHLLSVGTKLLVPFLSAAFASVIACICSQPGDMLLSLVNAHEGPKRTKDFLKEILESDHGVRGFFVGTNTRFLHVGLIVTLQLMIYDFVKRVCGIAATGIA